MEENKEIKKVHVIKRASDYIKDEQAKNAQNADSSEKKKIVIKKKPVVKIKVKEETLPEQKKEEEVADNSLKTRNETPEAKKNYGKECCA